MKKIGRIILVTLCIVMGLASFFAFSACNQGEEKEINVTMREGGSGTRDAFDGLVKNAAGDSLAKKADGAAQPSTIFAEGVSQYKTTAALLGAVQTNKWAIGYISLGSVNNNVKTLKVGGVEASAATILDNTYKLQRPFVVVNNNKVALTDFAANFKSYIQSTTAQGIVETEKYVKQETGKGTYTALTAAVGASEKVLIRGSTSVEPLMRVIIDEYIKANSGKIAAANFSIDCQGSNAGLTAANGDTAGNVIGMSSSAVNATSNPNLDQFNLALDAIAIIVNKDNNFISDITIAQLFDIYTGTVKKFSELA